MEVVQAMETGTSKKIEQLHRLAASYTPEWHFTEENPDAGSVLGILISDMLEDSSRRVERALHKHKLHYLNRFDALMKEPVSAARGYVQFTPVAGREGIMVVPRGTELSADSGEQEILYETMHDVCLADAGITSVIVTDGQEDKIVFRAGKETNQRLDRIACKAFDCSGTNEASHLFFICFDTILDHTEGLKLVLRLEAEKKEEAIRSAELLTSDRVEILMAEPIGEAEDRYREIRFDSITAKEDLLYLEKTGYTPAPAVLNGEKGYFLIIKAVKQIPELALSGLSVNMEKAELVPDKIRLEGTDTRAERFSPFGAPLQLLAECGMDSAEVFSKKDARITLSFDLDYEIREEKPEEADINIEYRTIMKRPPEAAYVKPVTVCADRVAWEYMSVTGWKRLMEDSESERVFNGEREGTITLQFLCPQDMLPMDDSGEPRMRVRLMQADHIYQMPAVYKCPVIKKLRFAYSYEGREQKPKSVYTLNNYQTRDCRKQFENGMNTVIFHGTERQERSMYFCFDHSIQGLPFTLYFDLENYSDLPVDFTVEYSRKDDFKPIRIVDGTNGMLNSGTMQFLISSDMEKRTLFGKEGYFLRFTGYEKEYPSYRLPKIKGIYPNVAKVENHSTSEEFFYIDDRNEELTVKLRNENLKQLTVWVHEKIAGKDKWVEWKQATHSFEYGRVYQADMAAGTITFGSFAFSDIALSQDGPEIMVKHRNYEGKAANVPEASIVTMRDSNRYVSFVTNPFPTYGGNDAYTEKSATQYITGVLRSRNRVVTEEDILDLLRQTSYSVEQIKCAMDVDALGNPAPGRVTIAVLTGEFDKGAHVFHEIREEMKKKLEECGSFLVMGKEVQLTQPHFLRLNIRLWLEKDTMENAYDMQNTAYTVIEEFLHPLTGGPEGTGWKIGSFPRVSQIRAYLRKRLKNVTIARLAVTTLAEDREVEIKEDISDISRSPFILPVSGEHVIHIDLRQ